MTVTVPQGKVMVRQKRRTPQGVFLLTMNCANCENTAKIKFCSLKCSAAFRHKTAICAWKNGTYDIKCRSSMIKNFILAKATNKCQICQISKWNDKPLVLVLDHIDGNAMNWSEENLRVICPNCDSQTITFKKRNNGKGRTYRKERYNAGKSY